MVVHFWCNGLHQRSRWWNVAEPNPRHMVLVRLAWCYGATAQLRHMVLRQPTSNAGRSLLPAKLIDTPVCMQLHNVQCAMCYVQRAGVIDRYTSACAMCIVQCAMCNVPAKLKDTPVHLPAAHGRVRLQVLFNFHSGPSFCNSPWARVKY